MTPTEKYNALLQKCHALSNEQLATVRIMLTADLCADARVAPLYDHKKNNAFSYFPFISSLDCFDENRYSVDLADVNVLAPIVDHRYKYPAALADCAVHGLLTDRLNGGQPCALYLADINLLIANEGKHHLAAAKALGLHTPHLYVAHANLTDYVVELDPDDQLTWNCSYGTFPADWRVAAIWTITQQLP